MHTVTAILSAVKLQGRTASDTLSIDWEMRRKRRMVMKTDGGREFLLDLPSAVGLRDGDGFELDKTLVVVRAKPEPLLEVRCAEPAALSRLAWHIGNRHAPCEFTVQALYVYEDHTLADMVRALGGDVRKVMRPFQPEGGAFAGHGHGHGYGHGHAHDHSH